jgi:hypothetical protein
LLISWGWTHPPRQTFLSLLRRRRRRRRRRRSLPMIAKVLKRRRTSCRDGVACCLVQLE